MLTLLPEAASYHPIDRTDLHLTDAVPWADKENATPMSTLRMLVWTAKARYNYIIDAVRLHPSILPLLAIAREAKLQAYAIFYPPLNLTENEPLSRDQLGWLLKSLGCPELIVDEDVPPETVQLLIFPLDSDGRELDTAGRRLFASARIL